MLFRTRYIIEDSQIHVALPGVEKTDIEVVRSGKYLSIKVKGEEILKFRLLDADTIISTYKNGLLTISLTVTATSELIPID